jgi:hypothetical protein
MRSESLAITYWKKLIEVECAREEVAMGQYSSHVVVRQEPSALLRCEDFHSLIL